MSFGGQNIDLANAGMYSPLPAHPHDSIKRPLRPWGPRKMTLQTHFAAPGRIVSGFAITTVWSSSRQHQTEHPLKYNKTNPICSPPTLTLACHAMRYAIMAKIGKNPISGKKGHLRHNYHPFVGGRVPRRLRREVNGVITIIGVVPDAGSNPA
jgi:hypothetical protein